MLHNWQAVAYCVLRTSRIDFLLQVFLAPGPLVHLQIEISKRFICNPDKLLWVLTLKCKGNSTARRRSSNRFNEGSWQGFLRGEEA